MHHISPRHDWYFTLIATKWPSIYSLTITTSVIASLPDIFGSSRQKLPLLEALEKSVRTLFSAPYSGR